MYKKSRKKLTRSISGILAFVMAVSFATCSPVSAEKQGEELISDVVTVSSDADSAPTEADDANDDKETSEEVTDTAEQPVIAYDLGDVNNDSKINAVDASCVLEEYAKMSTGYPSGFSAVQIKAGDVDFNGKINALDASTILTYYAYISIDGTQSFKEYLGIKNAITTTITVAEPIITTTEITLTFQETTETGTTSAQTTITENAAAESTITTTIPADIDSDNDGLTDIIENAFGTDVNKADTDADGLTDYQEILFLNTDPRKEDTDGNGVSDKDEDTDNDGISNLNEFKIGTNPLKFDTDEDDITDDEERVIGTDPLNEDTDGDGASDGWEKKNGFDPLNADQSFVIKKTDGAMSIVLECDGKYAAEFEADQISNVFLNDTIPGYISPAYDFTLDGNPFISAKLSFTFDDALTDDEEFDPVIYYFNEETQELETLETTVSGNTATAQLSHFSKYILLNRIAFEKVWQYQIKPREMNYTPSASLDIVFVIDYSRSMKWNDRKMLSLDVCRAFVEKMRAGKDKAAVVKFIKKADVVCNLTNNKNVVMSAIDSIRYDVGLSDDSGTNGSAGLNEAIRQLSGSSADYKYIVFLTDGEDTVISYSYDALISNAKAHGIKIYTIGLGNVSENILYRVASETGGRYFYATAGEKKIDIPELDEVGTEIEAVTIDDLLDNNDDGISDYLTKMMCEGKLRTDSGALVFGKKSYDEIINGGADYDGDTIKNGDEISIETKDGKTTVKIKTDPINSDPDKDGITDNEDSAPFDFGLSGGIIGYLTVASAPGNSKINNFIGHSWLLFDSKVDYNLDLSGIKEGGKKYSNLEIKRNEVLSIGAAALGDDGKLLMLAPDMSTLFKTIDPVTLLKRLFLQETMEDIYSIPGGLHVNWEFSFFDNCYPGWGNALGYTKPITEKQLKKLVKYWNKNDYYCLWNHNCSSVAREAWNKIFPSDFVVSDVSVEQLLPDFVDYLTFVDPTILSKIDHPCILTASIGLKEGHNEDYNSFMLDSLPRKCKRPE